MIEWIFSIGCGLVIASLTYFISTVIGKMIRLKILCRRIRQSGVRPY
jgi:hypothetical protein